MLTNGTDTGEEPVAQAVPATPSQSAKVRGSNRVSTAAWVGAGAAGLSVVLAGVSVWTDSSGTAITAVALSALAAYLTRNPLRHITALAFACMVAGILAPVVMMLSGQTPLPGDLAMRIAVNSPYFALVPAVVADLVGVAILVRRMYRASHA